MIYSLFMTKCSKPKTPKTLEVLEDEMLEDPLLVEDYFPWSKMADVVSEEVDEVLAHRVQVDEWLAEGLAEMTAVAEKAVLCPHCKKLFFRSDFEDDYE